MPSEVEEKQDVVNEGASTSTTLAEQKLEKKKNLPWIEKYRPSKFNEIMGKKFDLFLLERSL